MIEQKITARWENGIELYTKSNWTFWVRTGRHDCHFIIGEGMGKENEDRCMECGEKRLNI